MDIQPDDVHALRRDGDWHAYLRDLIRPTRHVAPARDGPTPRTHHPGHTPGAWPHGTQPPTSAVCRPDCGCATPPNPYREPNGSAPV